MEQLGRARAHEQAGADKAEQEARHDAPVHVPGAARDDRVEEGHPQRDRYDEQARHPRGGILLGPHDEGVAARQQEEPDDRQRAPIAGAARQPVAQRECESHKQQAGDQEAQAGEEEWRQLSDAHPDGEVGGSPEDAYHQVGDERLAAQRRHQSGSVRTRPGFSYSVESTIVVRVFIV